ncbi:hypothetical protein LB572_26050 [Mesorhizobium sp. BH1-1-5]|uniref:hypothetical protein n=1 Tax=Mesorhizobium sp. BH1-1-5 TaxID=2876661 RepID=UPI001CD0386B|nr:hypothetical protein [Mesorhizobium sp. BH1-1-5]MBZ9990570.1 hypothetical protein [Mesorhizobium sp. BH1-1-5]
MSLSEKLMVIVLTKRPRGVLSKLAPAFSPTQPKDVFGSLPSKGAPKTLKEMDAGVLAEARRHARV